MRSTRGFFRTSVRPQIATVLLSVLVAALGQVASPELIRPTQATEVPVIKPAEPQVFAAAVDDTSVNCAAVACLALTFDDGPRPEVTNRILDTLARYDAKATFFLVGQRIAGNEDVVRRMHQSGHEIGNHTWSHPKLSEVTPQEVEDDIARAQDAIMATGVPAPTLFRPPYGDIDSMVRSHVPAMTVVAWNVDPEDWKAKKPEQVIEHILAHAKPGAIIDLHDTASVTADALDPLLASLSQSYYLVTVSELLDLPSGQQGIFYGR